MHYHRDIAGPLVDLIGALSVRYLAAGFGGGHVVAWEFYVGVDKLLFIRRTEKNQNLAVTPSTVHGSLFGDSIQLCMRQRERIGRRVQSK